jgi:serralysin
VGGADTDVFAFGTATASGRGAARDVIQDLLSGTDRLDLRAIDADGLLAGNQAFVFLGAAVFSGASGELHLQGWRTRWRPERRPHF